MFIVPPIVPLVIVLGLIVIIATYFFTDPTNSQFIKGAHSRITFLLQAAIILAQVAASIFFPLPMWYVSPVISVFGVLFFLAGVILIIWAKIAMGKVWNMPGRHDIKRQSHLIINGPYRFTRNPIYLGDIIMHSGLGFALLSPLFFLPIILIFIFTREIKKEEKLLTKYFGDEYRSYCSHVPRFL